MSIVLSVPWLVLDLYLARHPELLRSPTDVKWMKVHAKASIGTLIGAAASIGLAFASPVAALVLYLVVAIGFVVLRLFDRNPIESSLSDDD